MSQSKLITKTIFERFSSDFLKTINILGLRFVTDNKNIIDMKGCYVCPLSLRAYRENELEKLSLEHVPQNSLNGKPIVLTDKEFNNNDGGSKDKMILNYFKFRNFSTGDGELDAIISAPGIVNGNISAKLIQISNNNNRPKIRFGFPYKTLDMLKKRGMIENWDGLKLNLKVNYSYQINRSALLKAAYLIAFSKIGYKLIFDTEGLKHNTYGAIINELKKDSVSDEFPFIFYENLQINMPDNIGIIRNDEIALIIVKVTYTLKQNTYQYYCLLPHPNDKSFDNLQKFINQIAESESQLNIHSINKDFLIS